MGEKQGKQKNVLLLTVVVIIWISMMAMTIQAYGAEARVVSTVVSDGFIYVYLRGITELKDGTMFQIGTEACSKESVAVGSMASLEIPLRTIVLVDNSKSIPEKNREDIQTLLKSIAMGAMEREQIRIGTISDQLTYQCEFTTDKEILNNIIEGITYSNQDTYLSDILYDVIVELERENSGIFTRIVIFADGADDKTIGYTNEEVRGLIEKSSYPIYTVGFSKKNNSGQLETMFSFARASSSEYYLVDGTITNEEIIDGLLQDQNDLCVRIRPDESLFDGGRKNLRLRLNTPEGEMELTATVQMPFGDGKERETESQEESTASQEETKVETAEETLPSIVPEKSEPEMQKKSEEKGTLLWLYMGLSILTVISAAILTVLILHGRRKNKEDRGIEEPVRAIDAMDRFSQEEETRLNCEEYPDAAKPLWEKKTYYVTLWNIDKPGISYTVPIEDRVRIGRIGNDINIADDNTVSKRHCELILRGEILYIRDVGSKNGTRHQNVRIDSERSVASGDTIEIGKSQYRVELSKKQ